MATYTTNYNLSMPEDTDTTASFIEDYKSNMQTIDGNLGGGGGGGGGHTILDGNGTMMPSRLKLQFTGNAAVTDDSVSNKTVVTVGDFYSTTEKVIGKWIDDKTLYQITFAFTTSSSSGWVAIPTDTTGWNIDFFTVKNVSIILQQYNYHYGMTGIQFFCAKDTNTGQIKYNCVDGSLRDKQIYLTVQYTKLNEPTPLHLVEYIESSGTQYINAGVGANAQSIRIESAIEFQTTSSDGFAWGGFGNGHYGLADIYNDRMYNRLKFFYGSNQSISVNSPVYSADTKYTIDMTATGSQISYTINGESATVAKGGSYLAPSDICLFRRGTDASYTGRCKMYYFKLYVDGTLVRNMKPALDDNNVACMYDEISGGYFYNLGTGVFTAGPDV